jgi:hypothetical protein
VGCFSLAWFETLLIWIVIIVAVIAILKIIVPYVLSKLQASRIVWCAITYWIFALGVCPRTVWSVIRPGRFCCTRRARPWRARWGFNS